MGIMKSIKKRLPIVGAGGNVAPPSRPAPQSRPAAPPIAPPEPPATARGGQDATEFIDAFVKEHTLVLFMKGSPEQPQCGFSAKAASVLSQYGTINHVDVIADPEVRQTIKDYSQWPTLPQVYVGGEFLGGSDILLQMHQAGELEQVIKEAQSKGE
ncbi:MAG: Grx4 family monothiol glutaredoxin [Myxococcota bacterium]